MDDALHAQVESYLAHPWSERGKAASSEQVKRAERDLGVAFDADHAEFLTTYGGCFVGVALQGFDNAADLEDVDPVTLTRRFRDEGWPGSTDAYVIATDNGNPIMIRPGGEVVTWDHDFDDDPADLRVLAPSFAAFLSDCLPPV